MLGSEQVGTPYFNSVNAAGSAGARAWLRSSAAEVWAKFLLGAGGTGAGFRGGTVLHSLGRGRTSLGSVILASVALLMAAFVGLITVPYLARRVALERLRQTFHYEVTKAGVVYVLVTLVIGIAALNTGNNLLYIVVAAMLAAILVSGVVSALVLRGLQLDVRLPEHVFAGRPVVGRIALRNAGRALPSFSIRVVPARKQTKVRKEWRWEPTTFVFPLNRSPQNQWVRLRDWSVRRVEGRPIPRAFSKAWFIFPTFLPRPN